MKNSRFKSKTQSKKSTYFIASISLAVFLLIALPTGLSDRAKQAAALPVAPAQKAAFFAANNISSFFSRLFSSEKAGKETQKLEQDIFSLKNTVIKQADIIFKLKNELKSLAEFHEQKFAGQKPVIANIIGYDTVALRKSITINAGAKQNIEVNDVVVYGNALIGRISVVSTLTSRAQLITDPAIRIPARVLETREQGIVKGSSGPECSLVYVPDTAAAKENDRVVTSGVGGIYPGSIFIGSITKSLKIDGELFLDISLKPAVDVSRIESVQIVKQIKIKAGD